MDLRLPVIEDAAGDSFLAACEREPVLDASERKQAADLARELIEEARAAGTAGPVERLLSAYGLGSEQGRALMELAEALLRVPDNATRDELIRDKLARHGWLARDAAGLSKAAGLGLHAADAILAAEHDGPAQTLISKLGMPAIRTSIAGAMRILAERFVCAPDIAGAMHKAEREPDLTHSYDMLGEAARTAQEEERFMQAYAEAIAELAKDGPASHPDASDGVSVKLTALCARYRARSWPSVCDTLAPRLLELAEQAKDANIALTVDAEEAARLEMSLGLFAMILRAPQLAGWEGFGVAVQAYSLRTPAMIDALARIAEEEGRSIGIRLVKGAYWDAEVKIAQEKGLAAFPVYTAKPDTDLAYLHLADRLMDLAPRVRPMFATHNAATLACVEMLARKRGLDGFEYQRIHGMGKPLHDAFRKRFSRRLRIYAPVGSYGDLLAYLVRRLLESSANTSFMRMLSDDGVPAAEIAQDPYAARSEHADEAEARRPRTGAKMFEPERANSSCADPDAASFVLRMRERSRTQLPDPPPAADANDADAAFAAAAQEAASWSADIGSKHPQVLERIADAYEKHAEDLYALLAQEGGKTIDDSIGEVREAVDFCRYYAARARELPADAKPRGTVVAISPWNFPMAIFTGQIAAALAAGNCVIAKPAGHTPRIAAALVRIMHDAGVPAPALQLLHGAGSTLGERLCSAGCADMIAFTGSTSTAQAIHRSIAGSAKPAAPLLAETGGINAMIVDSTALIERAVDDIIASAFRSAGQRCSSLRVLYVQEDIRERLQDMLIGACELLELGDPLDPAVDIGPVISKDAQDEIDAYVDEAQRNGRLVWRGKVPSAGSFCAPAIIEVHGMQDVPCEVFGPVLHIASYRTGAERQAVDAVNAAGYGLTFGLHSRILARQQLAAEAAAAGNIYINRNQIGAIVGSQPFGGHGLSGTGPKAGGPLYVRAFTSSAEPLLPAAVGTGKAMPGPDGELNRYSIMPRGNVLCLNGSNEAGVRAAKQAAVAAGNVLIEATEIPQSLARIDAVIAVGQPPESIAQVRRQMAEEPGPIIPLIVDAGALAWLHREKHCCTDQAAAGGNIALLA